MMSLNYSNIAILNIKGADYCCIISEISKSPYFCKISISPKTRFIIKHKNLLSHIKIGKETLTFGEIEFEKNIFYYHKSPIFKTDVDIEKVLVSKFLLVKDFLNTLLATCIMIIKLSHYL